MRFEQHYTISDESKAARDEKFREAFTEPVIGCIPWTDFERRLDGSPSYIPDCNMPWFGLFDVPWVDQRAAHYYVQGQSSSQAIDPDGAAHLKALCSDDVEDVRLSAAERRAIGAAASANGFFDLPSDLATLPRVLDTAALASYTPGHGMDTIVYITGYTCSESDLELSFEGRQNRVHWACNTAVKLGQEGGAPLQIRPVLAAIEKALRTHAPVKALLPFAQCPTLLSELARHESAKP